MQDFRGLSSSYHTSYDLAKHMQAEIGQRLQRELSGATPAKVDDRTRFMIRYYLRSFMYRLVSRSAPRMIL